MTEGIGPGRRQTEAGFCSGASARRYWQSPLAPDRIAHGGLSIGESRARFGVPRGGRDPLPLVDREPCSQQRDDREQGEQAGRGAGDGLVRPLPPRLDTEMGARFLEGDLNGPATHEPSHDLRGLAHRFGAEQGLRCNAALGIAHQHPSDRHDRQTAVPPHGGPGGDLKGALGRPVPARHHDRVPARVLDRKDRVERRQPRAFGPRASDRARRPRWGRLVESSIQPQAGDRRDAGAAHRVEEQQSREAAVAHHHEVACAQPAASQESELASDVEQRLVPTTPFATGAL